MDTWFAWSVEMTVKSWVFEFLFFYFFPFDFAWRSDMWIDEGDGGVCSFDWVWSFSFIWWLLLRRYVGGEGDVDDEKFRDLTLASLKPKRLNRTTCLVYVQISVIMILTNWVWTYLECNKLDPSLILTSIISTLSLESSQ